MKNIIEVSLDDVLTGKVSTFPILDSKLIVTTKLGLYNVKLVECGSYVQLYCYSEKKARTTGKDTSDLELREYRMNKIFGVTTTQQHNTVNEEQPKVVEQRNIIRSKLECQRLAKANMSDWKTFITLTFEDTTKFDVTNVDDCNKRLRYFIDKVKRVYPEFKYICVPEFQKRGAVHYHLLTNIAIDNEKLIYKQNDNPRFFHIKYWIDGFTSVEKLKNEPKKVIGYIAKYMTKDIDQKLFNRHRYFYSRNLITPSESYIDLDNPNDCEFLLKKIRGKEKIYSNQYINSFDGHDVEFQEFCG